MNYLKSLSLIVVAMLLCLSASGVQAQAQESQQGKVSTFDWSTYSYSYTAGGATQTKSLVEKATTTQEIFGLLNAVYTNAEIPGIWYGYDYNGTKNGKINYDAFGRLGTPSWLNYSGTIPQPDQDGMTLLLVQMTDGWKHDTPASNTESYIQQCYSSVQLIPNFLRVNDESNPGYIFTLDEVTASRFFFISKGKARYTYSRPLHRCFEQISPVVASTPQEAVTTNFYPEMLAGHSYLCDHDCGDVPTVGIGHEFTIANNGEAFSLKNLSIFIPDRRFEYNQYTKDNSTNYGNSYNYYCYYRFAPDLLKPKVLLYTANLSAEAQPSSTRGYYQINLSWTTSFTKENLGVDIPQQYYVYIVEGNNRIRLASIETWPTTETTHSYLVQQTTDPQVISYIVTAEPIGKNGNMQAETPVRTVTIPGYSPYFTEASEYRSRYDIDRQENIYKNKLTIMPTTEDDYAAIRNNQNAYDVTRTDAEGNKVTIAHVQFTENETGGYSYAVSYEDDTQVTDHTFDSEAPVNSGRLAAWGEVVTVIDRFTASTATNSQSTGYTYQLEQTTEEHDGKYSNALAIPVYTTEASVTAKGFTKDQVDNDVNYRHSQMIPVAGSHNTITFSAIDQPAANLQQYDVIRVNDKVLVAKAQHKGSGRYQKIELTTNGQLTVDAGEIALRNEVGPISVNDDNYTTDAETVSYVPVINTLCNGNLSKPNSYGCNYVDVKRSSFEFGYRKSTDPEDPNPSPVKTEPFSGKSGLVMAYGIDLQLKPVTLSEDESHVYRYRIWRNLSDKTEYQEKQTLLNDLTDISSATNARPDGSEWPGSWGTSYGNIKPVYPYYELAGEGTVDESGMISVYDLYLDDMMNGTKTVNYVARMYTTPVERSTPSQGPRKAYAPTADGKYYVYQKEFTVVYDQNIITGVNSINLIKDVKSRVYYNLLGVPSATPHKGMNIIVTHYTDGTMTTVKEAR